MLLPELCVVSVWEVSDNEGSPVAIATLHVLPLGVSRFFLV